MALVEAVVRNAADTALLEAEEVVVEVACVLLLDFLVRGLAGAGRSAVLTKQVALPLVPTPALKDMAIVPAKKGRKKGESLMLLVLVISTSNTSNKHQKIHVCIPQSK